MKVIDLLNKIANGEEVPKYIIGKDSLGTKQEYVYDNNFWYKHFFENPDGEEDYYFLGRDINNLNDEVEIIEEDKKIEKIPYRFNLNYIDSKLDGYTKEEINDTINHIYDKINEILDKGE